MSADFDRIARVYRWMEYAALGQLLQRTRAEYLPRLDGCRRALVLGDGDGRFTEKLLMRHPRMRVLAVDKSKMMLQLLHARCATAHERLELRNEDALVLLPSTEMDLVVTHFFLDCLTQAEAETLIEQTASRLDDGALWLVSEFRAPHWPARLYVRGLYLAFRWLTGLRVTSLPDYATPLERAGFRLVEQRLRLFGMLTSQLWQKAAAETPGRP